ncbi:hypothetical protein [Actinomycetospora soli]|uniref:hypothetical protein n=1 Tax=Actinomycetospora soli TaxID=2893887 RepID=UPI001E611394|nr:hypothetical protein [Actinomycetospora soli]MCD2191338.1 hypothetical protein [Actinomycetospora soli]
MTEVDWEHIVHVYEDMVAVLLSNLHPHAERIDGSGGDGGRDVQLRENDRLDIYELKSFTGRLSTDKGRRAQVERSLHRAAALEPTSWSLVVPIDHSPAELEWFDGLRSNYSFPLHWHGRTWLNARCADLPRVRRYFLEDGHEAALRIVREIAEEKEYVGDDVSTGLARLQRLADQLDHLEPFYRARVIVDHDRTRIEVYPRYLGAERERPVFLTGRIRLSSSDVDQQVARRLRDYMRFGDEVEIPAELTGEIGLNDDIFGLSQYVTGSTITLAGAEPEEVRFTAQLHIYDPEGTRLATLPILITERRRGQSGARLTGADPTNSVRVELSFDLLTLKADLGIRSRQAPDLLPGPLLALLKFLEKLRQPNSIALQLGREPVLERRPLDSDHLQIEPELVDAVEKLELIQRESGTPFPVPEQFSHADIQELDRAYRYFTGRQVRLQTSQLTTNIHLASLNDWESWILTGEPMAVLFIVLDYTYEIADVAVPAGRAAIHLSPVRVANGQELLDQQPWTDERSVRVQLRVDEGGAIVVLRAAPEDHDHEL